MHASTLQSCSDGDLAPGFDNPRGSAKALLVEVGISHTITIVVDVVSTFPGFLAVGGVTVEGA